jgi:hypothetical protein
LTPENIQTLVRDARALYRSGALTPTAVTIQLYRRYVEVVQEIAQGDVEDPEQLCAALVAAVAREFPDRPWAQPGK